MKVVMVAPYPMPGNPISGGVERVVDTLLAPLARRVDLTLLVPGAPHDAREVMDGATIVHIERSSRMPGVLRYARGDAKRVAHAVEQIDPDIVHVQAAAGWASALRRPFVATVHGIAHRNMVEGRSGPALLREVAGRYVRHVERVGLERATGVIVINPFVVEALPELQGARTFAISNPVDPTYLAPSKGQASRTRSIVTIGKVGPQKNTLGLIEAAIALMKTEPMVTLDVIGPVQDASHHERCKQAVREAGLENRIRFCGALSAHEIRDRLDRASLFVMASRQETAPVAIAEAHARGVPVLAPKAFGIPYMIRERVDGLFLPDANPSEQAELLERALDIEWDHQAIARRAWETYGVEAIADRTVEAYRACLGEAP